MKKNNYNNTLRLHLLAVIFFAMFTIQGCKKILQLPVSPILVENDYLFTDDLSATSAVLGLYAQSLTSMHSTNGGLSVYTGLYADDIYTTATSASYDPFYKNTLLPANGVVNTNFWRYGYANLFHANALIEGLENATLLTPAVKQQLLGEAKFMRAWFYFNLVNLFGDVPLITSTVYKENAVLPRAPVTEIYQLILSDLSFAKANLATAYSTAGKLRPNKWAAVALLARTQLYLQNWQQAYDNATELITAGNYQLTTDLNNSFAPNNTEAIWQLVRDNANTPEAATFIPSSATVRPALALTDTLIKLFEPNDKRKVNWTKANTVSGTAYFYPFKYKLRTNTPLAENKQPLRYAEVLLIRAEAAIQLNKLDTALNDINKIRNRAGLLLLSNLTAAQLTTALEKERRLEFFAEDAHRWFDLKRWNKATAVLQPIKTGWSATALLFPIPETEIEKNPFLLQNPGY